MYQFFPVFNRIRKVLLPTPSLDDFCHQKHILCDEEQGYMPGISIDDTSRRDVVNAMSMTTLEHEWRRVDGYTATHQATVRYEFKDALATPNGFHVFGATFSGSGKPYLRALTQKNIPILEKGFYATIPVTTQYFGHWLTDGLSTALLKKNDETLYLWSPPSWRHSLAYLDALGMEAVSQDYVFFKNLTFCQDIGMTTNRRARLRELKKKINALGPLGAVTKKVYLRRRDSGAHRVLENDAEISSALENIGFNIVDVYAPLDQILEACVGADLTISVEGSHTAHLILGAQIGAQHIIINPADRFNNVFADYMPALGDHIHTIVANRSGAGYTIDVRRVLELINSLEPGDVRPV